MINNAIDLVYEDNAINKSVVHGILCIRDYGGATSGVGFILGHILFLDTNL